MNKYYILLFTLILSNQLDVVGTLVGKATTAVITVTFRGTVKVVTFTTGKSGVKFIEATLNQTRYTLKLFSAGAQEFKKIDWTPVRVVSMVGPNGKTINARVIINPLEQLKNVKYSIKKILSDENGVALRDADGEYAAVVSHKQAAEEVEELAVIKEGGDVGEGAGVSNLVARVQAKLSLYPKVPDPRTGINIKLPYVDKIVPKADRVIWDLPAHGKYIKEWYDKGYTTPAGGWDKYDIHHIKPREFGGTNDFWNLVPVERTTHQKEFNEFWRQFGEL